MRSNERAFQKLHVHALAGDVFEQAAAVRVAGDEVLVAWLVWAAASTVALGALFVWSWYSNRRARERIVELLSRHGELTGAELARLGPEDLDGGTVYVHLVRLEDEGLVRRRRADAWPHRHFFSLTGERRRKRSRARARALKAETVEWRSG
jgi:DNA-binding transcriptional ArsR family regulator